MTKTLKTCFIFSISAVWLVLMRMLFSAVSLGDYLIDWLFSFSVQVIGMGVVPFVLYRFWVKEDPWQGFCLKRRLPLVVYLLTIVVGLVFNFLLTSVSAVWQTVLQLIGYTQTNSAGTVYPARNALGVLIMELLTTAVLPGIFEEITYRGLGMQMLSGVEDERWKIILIGLLFGFGHQFIGQTGYAFVAGMIFAYLIIKTRSIIPGMIIHFMNNAISVINDYSAQKTGAVSSFRDSILSVFFNNVFFLLLFIAGLIVLIVVLLRLIKILSRTEEEVVPDASAEEYYYPNKKQYVDDIFGDLEAVREPIRTKTVRGYEYAPLYGASVIMLLTTLFSFIWGMGR